ncbi:uncharacterized protein LOC120688611 isoform X2 [Panicum virgatum]|uniref:uncharacterized protein LOC120688611 isoform X2 n=1 Tax=Panicum virgatum TaxID=38727 RepID=UPI0019D649B1|nr:uncharacterized protein LOC120688611 isoform X2 [Panicum virgatum]
MEKEKRRSWFERIRRLFTSSSEPKEKPKPDKAKSKRWLSGKLRTQQSFALPAPAPDQQIRQAEDEQSKHAVAVALATAAAAEAAVAAAHAAAEVVRLTGQPPATPPPGQEPEEAEHAAVLIQSAYRGYLARRALRALKGLVRLQALIRGQAVRRQTAATLRGLESLMRIQARHRSRAGGPDHPAVLDGNDDDDDAFLLRRGRELYAAAVHVTAAAGGQQGVGQQHPLQGGDARRDAEPGGGRPQARARAAVRLPAERAAGRAAAAAAQGRGGGGRAPPALELARGVGRRAAPLRQGRPRGAPVALQQGRRRQGPPHAGPARRPARRPRRRRPARLLGPAVVRAAEACAGAGGRLLLRGRRAVLAGAVPGVHGVHGLRQGQVPVHEHAQGALRWRRRLLRALLPVRRPHALADPVHVAHPLHRQRHGLRQVHQAARCTEVAAGGGQGPHDAGAVALTEVAEPPQLRLRGRAAPAADGALHSSPVSKTTECPLLREATALLFCEDTIPCSHSFVCSPFFPEGFNQVFSNEMQQCNMNHKLR